MKKLACLMLVCALLAGALLPTLPGTFMDFPGSALAEQTATPRGAAHGAVFVDSAEAFIEAVESDASATILLTGSFSMGGYSSHTYFSGLLDGQGFTISGLSITAGEGGAYGLFAGLYGGTVQNLNLEGASATVAAGDDYTKVGLLCGAFDNRSKIHNCHVSGSITVTGGSVGQNIFTGGIAGLGMDGIISGSVSEVDISVMSAANVTAGGIISMLNAGIIYDTDYNGNIEVAQSGSSLCQFKAFGTSYSSTPSRNCNVSGSIRVTTNNGTGSASGLNTADCGTNSAEVSATTATGYANANGCCEGRYLINTGAVTATSNSAQGHATACGVNAVSNGKNRGQVTASGPAGTVSAIGAAAADRHTTNSAGVSAACDQGEANATGVYGLGDANHSYECDNSGAVSARCGDGSAFAVGVSGCMKSNNTGSVTVSVDKGSAAGQGITNTHYGVNSGDVTVTYTGSKGVSGAVSAQGLNGCTGSKNLGGVYAVVEATSTAATATGVSGGGYCENRGRVEARNPAGPSNARGVLADNSQNYGYIFAHSTNTAKNDSGNATAFGVGPGYSHSLNEGSVTAISRAGGAKAYGYGASCYDCVSTGIVAATGELFEANVTSDHAEGWIGTAYAYNSTTTQATSSSYTISAAGGERIDMYYFFAASSCKIHGGMARQYVSCLSGSQSLDGCFVPCGAAYSTGEFQYEAPQVPETPEEPDEYLDDLVLATLSLDVVNDKNEIVPFSSFTYACGSLVPGSAEDGVEYGSTFNLNLRVWANETGAYPLTLHAPEGFSFEPWSIVRDKPVTVSLAGGVAVDRAYTVYPIYMGTFADRVTFSVTRASGGATNALDSLACAVWREENEGVIYCRPTAYVNTSNDAIEVNVNEMGLDFAESFATVKTAYSDPLAKFGCAMTQAVYGTTGGDRTRYMVDSLRDLGFSEGEWYEPGFSAPLEVAAYIAQKKVSDGENVRNVLLIDVRGTYSVDWIGNFYAYGNDDGHMNFIYAAQKIREKVDTYVRDHMSTEEYARTTAYICGHSRAGAVADILAYWMEYDGWDYFCSAKTVYTYAAANAFFDPMPDNSVHNIMFVTDVVGFVPFDMYKYGTTYVIGTKDDLAVPGSVHAKYYEYAHQSYTVPRSDRLINFIVFCGLVASKVEGVVPDFDQLSADARSLVQKALFYVMGELFDNLADAGLRVQFAGGTFLGIITGVCPMLDTKIQWIHNICEEIKQNTLDSGISRAHGAENYLAWIMAQGVAGARGYDVVSRELIDQFDPSLIFEDVKGKLTDFAENVKAGADAGIDLLKAMAEAGLQAAGDALDAAVEAADAAERAVEGAIDAAERAARELSLAAAREALETARKAYAQKEYAMDALQRMARDLANSALEAAPGLLVPSGWSAPSISLVGVSCPVDVDVTSGGTSALRFTDHSVSGWSGDYYGESVDETDFFLIDDGAAFEITGTAEGSMNVTLMRFDGDGRLESASGYLGIPVEAGETYAMRGRQLVSGGGAAYDPEEAAGLTLLEVRADRSVAQIGETAAFTARAVGGVGALSYDFSVYRDGALYDVPETSDSPRLEYAFPEEGAYTVSAIVTDETGAQAGPVVSRAVTVARGTSDARWDCIVDLKEEIIGGDYVWCGNIYGICYDGVYLNCLQDCEVSVAASAGTVVGELNENWWNVVNFFVSDLDETTDVRITVTIHRKGDTDANYDDLRITRALRVCFGDDVTPLPITDPETPLLVMRVDEDAALSRPQIAVEDETNAWWVGYEFENFDCCWSYEDESGLIHIVAYQPGETRLNFFSGAFAYRSPSLKSVRILVLGPEEALSFLRLPDGLREIEAEAFEGIAANVAAVPDGCTSIGARAFADCPNLVKTQLPASVTSISRSAFDASVVIEAPEGSYAAQFARRYGFPLIAY